jgi:hypothetical protein
LQKRKKARRQAGDDHEGAFTRRPMASATKSTTKVGRCVSAGFDDYHDNQHESDDLGFGSQMGLQNAHAEPIDQSTTSKPALLPSRF